MNDVDIKNLDQYISDYKIFIDTSSLLENYENTVEFIRSAAPILLRYNSKLLIPLRVMQEIIKHKNNAKNPDLQQCAEKVYNYLANLWQKKKYILLCGDDDHDNFADNVFQVVFTKLRMKYKLLLITQDNKLAQDILKLNDIQSVRGKEIDVLRFDKNGKLSRFKWDDLRESEKFTICTQVTSISDTQIEITNVPQEGEKVYLANGVSVLLEKRLAAGGEGTVYSTDKELIAKVYKSGKLTLRKYKKITRMIEHKLNLDGVCFPQKALYNNQQEFVGYLMPKAKGYELQRSIFIKPQFLKKLPGWTKTDMVQLCVTILKKIKYLHDRNIIIGDINPANIMVVSPMEIYIVDTDSFQIDDLPCPVGTANFTAPEIQRKRFSDFLRTMEQENFAVATLLFMLMLPGKPPYSQQGGTNIIDNVIKQQFSYQLGTRRGKSVPDGIWRFMWSQLPYKIKEAFYETFQKNGNYCRPTDRLNSTQWLKLFEDYLTRLHNNIMQENDEQADYIYPTRFKRDSNVRYVNCIVCGKNEVPHRLGEIDVCSECIKKEKEKIVCQDCGNEFIFTYGDYYFYEKRGYAMPKRCDDCRRKKNKGNLLKGHSYFARKRR